jgi:hypothetical protein
MLADEVMTVPFLLGSLLALASPPSDPALAARIPQLLHVVLAADDESQNKAAITEAREIFSRRGLPTVAEVGDEAAYEFVVLTCSPGPSEFQAKVLSQAKRALARRAVPPDAVLYCEMRVRQEKVKARVRQHSPTHPALRDEIQRLYVTDQAVRQTKGFDLAKMAQEDRAHEGPVRAIFEKHGVPTYEMVGVEAASMFVAMVQHQSAELRRQVLPKLKANVDAGQADAGDYAMVYDRSSREAGRKQLYGQNLECDAGSPALHETPIEHEEDVDARRARIGLLRLELYARMVSELSPGLCPAEAPPAK